MKSFSQSFGESIHQVMPALNTLSGLVNSGNVGGNITELPALNENYVACDDNFFVQPDGTVVNLFTVKELYNTKSSQTIFPSASVFKFSNVLPYTNYGSLTATKIRDVTYYKDTTFVNDNPYGLFEASPTNWFTYRCVDDLHQDYIITGFESGNIPAGNLNVVIPETIGGKPVVGIESRFNSILASSIATVPVKNIPSGNYYLVCSSQDGSRVYVANYYDAGIYVSVDKGTSWNNIGDIPAEWTNNISCSANGSVIYTCSYFDNIVRYSMDYGVSFSPLAFGYIVSSVAVSSDGTKAIVSCQGGHVYLLSNNVVYSSFDLTGVTTNDYCESKFSHNDTKIVTLDHLGRVHRCDWSASPSPSVIFTGFPTLQYMSPGCYLDVSYSGDRIIFSTDSSQVFSSTNAGASFSSDFWPYALSSNVACSESNFYISPTYGENVIYKSSDGTNYDVIAVTVNSASSCFVTDNDDLFISGSYGADFVVIQKKEDQETYPIVSFKTNTICGFPDFCFDGCTSLEEIYSPACRSFGNSFVYGCSSLKSVFIGMDTANIVTNAFVGSSNFNFFFPAGELYSSTLSDGTLSRSCYPYLAEGESSVWFVEEKKSISVPSIQTPLSALVADINSKANNLALYGAISSSSETFDYTVNNDLPTLTIDYSKDTSEVSSISYTLDDSGFVEGSNDTVLYTKYTETKVELMPVVTNATRTVSSVARVLKFEMSHIQRIFVSFDDVYSSITDFDLYVSGVQPTSVTSGDNIGTFSVDATNHLLLELNYTSNTSNVYLWFVPNISVIENNIKGYSTGQDGYPAIVIDPQTGETSLPIILPPYGYSYTSSVNLVNAEEDYNIYSPYGIFPSEWLNYETFVEGYTDYIRILSVKTELIPSGISNIDIRLPATIEGKTVREIGDFFNCDPYSYVEKFTIKSIFSTTVVKIGDSAFQNCFTLQSVDISSLLEVGNYCFSSCGCLFYNFPSLGVIGDSGFSNAEADSLLYLGASVPSIGEGAFENSIGLTALYPYGADLDSTMYNFGTLYDANPSGNDFVYCLPYTDAVKGQTFTTVIVSFDSGDLTFMNGGTTCSRKYKIGEAYNSFPTASRSFYVLNGWISYPNTPILATYIASGTVTALSASYTQDMIVFSLNGGGLSYSVSSLKAGVELLDPFNLVIPTTYNGKPVTKIVDSFNVDFYNPPSLYYRKNKYKILSVSGSSILEVGDSAFAVTFNGVFPSCLEEISLPACVTFNGLSFSGNTLLRNLSFPNLTTPSSGFCGITADSLSCPILTSCGADAFRDVTLGSLSLPMLTSCSYSFVHSFVPNLTLPLLSSISITGCFSGAGGTSLSLPSLTSLASVTYTFQELNVSELWITSITNLGTTPFRMVGSNPNVYFGSSVPTFTGGLGNRSSPIYPYPENQPLIITFRYPAGASAWITALGGGSTWNGYPCLPYTP
jgi:hypothetical protein